MNKIAQLPAPSRAQIFAETASRVGFPEALVEKDFWVCWMLGQLFSIEELQGKLLFKGGTSLSKVFGAIQRFSEDIDLAVDYAMLGFVGPSDPLLAGLSRTKQIALLSRMLLECQEYIGGEFLNARRTRCTAILGFGTGWNLLVDRHDPNVVRFFYPGAIQSQVAYVAPQVILELGTHAEFIPRGEFSIRCFAAIEFPHLFEHAEARVASILAKRTFWEKATILHAEFHRPADKPLPGRYSRHYYDLAMMVSHPVKKEALDDFALLAAVVKHRRTFYPSAWAQYQSASQGTFRLAPSPARLASVRQDYRDMQVMIFGDPPHFEWIIETLVDLEHELNSREPAPV